MRARTGVDTVVKASLADVINFFSSQGFAGDIHQPYICLSSGKSEEGTTTDWWTVASLFFRGVPETSVSTEDVTRR